MISYLYSTMPACRAEAKRFGKPCLLFYDTHADSFFYSTDSEAYVLGAFPFAFVMGKCNQEEKKEEPMPEIKCPTKEQILNAAKEDYAVKKALEKLFPEAFEPQLISFKQIEEAISMRTLREYEAKGVYLSERYEWSIVTDSGGAKVLIATTKP